MTGNDRLIHQVVAVWSKGAEETYALDSGVITLNEGSHMTYFFHRSISMLKWGVWLISAYMCS